MPGYEPFLLCDFHVHTQWSDGRLTLAEVVDLYGSTGKFDVIAITDHILMKKDVFARAGRLASLGRRAFGVRQDLFEAYLADIRKEARRARDQYGMLVIPGAEITQNRLRGRMNSHIIALDIKEYISADQSADAILREIKRQGALSIACHPHHRTTRRVEISTCYLWDHRKELSGLVDVWEAANRDDLFSVTSLKHYPYVANSDFHKAKHLYSWKTLLRCEKNWPAIKDALRRNVDVALTLYRNGSWAAKSPRAKSYKHVTPPSSAFDTVIASRACQIVPAALVAVSLQRWPPRHSPSSRPRRCSAPFETSPARLCLTPPSPSRISKRVSAR